MDERRVLSFKQYVLEEGEVWDALCHGVKSGMKAYQQKRVEQKKHTDAHKLAQQILNAEGSELQQLVKQIVAQGLRTVALKSTEI